MAERFNHSGFSHFINSPAGRVFRLIAGTGFLALGIVYRHHPLGVASMAWSALPLSAGALDICFISGLLGGPLSGAKIRDEEDRRHLDSPMESTAASPPRL